MATTSNTTTTTAVPWKTQGPYLSKLYDRADDLWRAKTGFNAYTGQTQADLDPYTTQSQGMVAGMAQGPNPMLDAGVDNLTATMRGDFLSHDSNPYMAGMLDDITARTSGAVNSAMSGAGRYGSRAHTDTMSRGVAGAVAPHLFGAYNAERGRQMQGQALMPMTNELRYDGATRLAGLGDFNMGREQQRLDTARQLWEQKDNAPWMRLNAYQGNVAGTNPGGTTTTTGSKPGMTGLQGLLGGAMTGASLGSMFGPIGTGVGALAGGLGGGLLGSW